MKPYFLALDSMEDFRLLSTSELSICQRKLKFELMLICGRGKSNLKIKSNGIELNVNNLSFEFGLNNVTYMDANERVTFIAHYGRDLNTEHI